MKDPENCFADIVEQALRLGIIDIFVVVQWYLNETPADEVVAEIREKALEKRATREHHPACPAWAWTGPLP